MVLCNHSQSSTEFVRAMHVVLRRQHMQDSALINVSKAESDINSMYGELVQTGELNLFPLKCLENTT